MKKTPLTVMMILASGVACHGQFYFEAGPWYRGNMEISADGGSRAANEGVHASREGTSGGTPAALAQVLQDDGTAQTLRTFNDGYVGPSGWAWAQASGISQYWSYDNASQYNAGADTLSFTRSVTGTETAQRTLTQITPGTAGWSGSDRVGGVGIQGKLGYLLHTTKAGSLGVQLQVGWLADINSSFRNKSAYTEQVQDSRWQTTLTQGETWAYTYDTLGNPAFPAAPYRMSDPSGVGPMMADHPDSMTRLTQTQSAGEELASRSSSTATSLVDMDVNATALVLALGPRFHWQATQKLAITVQPGVSLNLLDADISRRETFRRENGTVVQSWADSKTEQDWLLGAGVQAEVQWMIKNGLYIMAGSGYDWVEPCDLPAGPDTVTLDLSGYTVSAGLGYRF